MRSRRLSSSVLLLAALTLVGVLAMLAPSVQLSDGTPFSLSLPQLRMGGAPDIEGGGWLLLVLRAMLALAILGLPVYIVISLLTKEGRRRLVGHLVAVALLTLLLQALQALAPSVPEGQTQTMQQAQPETVAPAGTPPPEAVFDRTTSEEAVTTATIVVALLLALAALGVVAAILRRPPPPPPSALDDIADDARQAIDALQAGDALEETIQRCYRSMCDVVQRERRIQRAAAVTPHEFEESLAQAGLPRDAVHTLTELFERIRYGNRPAGADEQAAALTALSAIVAACETGKRETRP
jgi:hypothetical protein